MAKIIELMQLSPTMKTGTFVRWVKKPGDAVKPDTIIAEIETDKAIMEMMAFDEGILLATLASEGDQLPVGAPIAIVGNIGEEISEILQQANARLQSMKLASSAQTPVQETPSQKPSVMEETQTPQTKIQEDRETTQKEEETQIQKYEEEPSPSTQIQDADFLEAKPVHPLLGKIEIEISDVRKPIIDRPALNGDISIPPHISLAKSLYRTKFPASPQARKLAENYGVDLTVVVPADGKRITAKDVEEFLKNRKLGPAKEIKPDKRVPVSGIRKIIAERLYQSKKNIPHYYLTIEFDADPVLELREKMNRDLAELHEDIKFTLNDFIIRAVAKSLQKHPVVNSSWQGDTIVQYGRIDIGIAVALDSGLITPYVRNADQLEFLEMVKQIRKLVKRARERKLKPEEYTNGTFTVSNLGMYGIKEFSAIINEPEAAILAVGTIQQKPVVKNNQITIGNIVSVTLSCDHRVIDGAEGASFLQTFKKYIENPYMMFM